MPPGCTAGSPSAPPPATSSTATSRATTRSSPTASTSTASGAPCPSPAGRTARGTSSSSAASSRARACSTCSRPTGSCARPAATAGSSWSAPGPQEREARRYVATRRLQGVEFLGRVSDEEKAQLFRTADVYVSPATGRRIVRDRPARGDGRRARRSWPPTSTATRASSAAASEGLLVPPREPQGARRRHRPGSSSTTSCAREMGASGRRARRGVQLGADHGQGRRLLRLRHPPPGGPAASCPPASAPRSRALVARCRA